MNVFKFLPVAGALVLSACGGQTDSVAHDVSMAPSDAFMAAVAAHCGKAYEGHIAVNEPRTDAPDPFDGKRLVMHVRGCEDSAHELRIPFHVGDDHSRTWVLSRTDTGLRLKHDHRHEDGSPDAVTMYGGDSTPPGTAQRQAFPADADSVAMFRKAGMDVSVSNAWAMEIEPDERFVYELTRPEGRRFQVVFDLSKPVALPPAPWGG